MLFKNTDVFYCKNFTDSGSSYASTEEIPALEKYSRDNADLFKQDLGKAAKIVGGEVARLYTYY
ncbi:MAG: hypothetical protein HZB31_11945 [Nitrospirae bacterium]|nr:hypothetical protein [Nitrospirota bacterium]